MFVERVHTVAYAFKILMNMVVKVPLNVPAYLAPYFDKLFASMSFLLNIVV